MIVNAVFPDLSDFTVMRYRIRDADNSESCEFPAEALAKNFQKSFRNGDFPCRVTARFWGLPIERARCAVIGDASFDWRRFLNEEVEQIPAGGVTDAGSTVVAVGV